MTTLNTSLHLLHPTCLELVTYSSCTWEVLMEEDQPRFKNLQLAENDHKSIGSCSLCSVLFPTALFLVAKFILGFEVKGIILTEIAGRLITSSERCYFMRDLGTSPLPCLLCLCHWQTRIEAKDFQHESYFHDSVHILCNLA